MEPSCKWPLGPGDDGTYLHVVFTLCTMGPSTLSTRALYLGSEIHGLGTQVYPGRTFKSTTVATAPWVRNPWPRYTSRLRSHIQVHYGGNRTLGLKSLAQVLKPTPVAQVGANGRTQAHSSVTSRLRSQS
jgi:hypothetical protein